MYVVYLGECRFHKSNIKVENVQDIKENISNMKTILHLGRGGIAGLELLANYKLYKYNLISSREFTVLLKIPIKFLNEYCRQSKKNLLKLFNNQEKIINEYFTRFDKLMNNKKVTYSNIIKQNDIDIEIKSIQSKSHQKIKKDDNSNMKLLINNIEKSLSKSKHSKDSFRHTHVRFSSLSDFKKKNNIRNIKGEENDIIRIDPYNSFYSSINNYKKNVPISSSLFKSNNNTNILSCV